MAKTTAHKPDYEEAEEAEDVSHAHESKPGPVSESRQQKGKHEHAVPEEKEKAVPAPLERAVPAPLETRDAQSVVPRGNPPVYVHAPGLFESAGMPDPEQV